MRRTGDGKRSVKLHDEIGIIRFGRDLDSAFILQDNRQCIAVAANQLSIDADLMQHIALRQPGIGDLDFDGADGIFIFTSFLDACNGKRLALIGHCRCIAQFCRGHRACAAYSAGEVHTLTSQSFGEHGRAKGSVN